MEPENWSVRKKLLLKAPVPLPLETRSDVEEDWDKELVLFITRPRVRNIA